jgi:protein kinase A
VRYPQGFDAGAYDLVQNCLTADLSKRYGNLHRGSGEIFRHSWFSEVEWDLLLSKEIPAPYIPDLKGEGDSSQ